MNRRHKACRAPRLQPATPPPPSTYASLSASTSYFAPGSQPGYATLPPLPDRPTTRPPVQPSTRPPPCYRCLQPLRPSSTFRRTLLPTPHTIALWFVASRILFAGFSFPKLCPSLSLSLDPFLTLSRLYLSAEPSYSSFSLASATGLLSLPLHLSISLFDAAGSPPSIHVEFVEFFIRVDNTNVLGNDSIIRCTRC